MVEIDPSMDSAVTTADESLSTEPASASESTAASEVDAVPAVADEVAVKPAPAEEGDDDKKPNGVDDLVLYPLPVKGPAGEEIELQVRVWRQGLENADVALPTCTSIHTPECCE